MDMECSKFNIKGLLKELVSYLIESDTKLVGMQSGNMTIVYWPYSGCTVLKSYVLAFYTTISQTKSTKKS
jgi:hypothetical protein